MLCLSGFGTGVAFSAVFVAVQAAVDRAHIAPAVSMVYLAQGFGGIVGLAASSAVFSAGLRATLEGRLVNLHLDAGLRNEVRHHQDAVTIGGFLLTFPQIISNAVASMNYIYKSKGDVANAIVDSYVDGLWYSHFVSLFASLMAFTLTALLREYKL